MLKISVNQMQVFSLASKENFVLKMLCETDDLCFVALPDFHLRLPEGMTPLPTAHAESGVYRDLNDFLKKNETCRREAIETAIERAKTYGIRQKHCVGIFVHYIFRCALFLDCTKWPAKLVLALENPDITEAEKAELLNAELTFGGTL